MFFLIVICCSTAPRSVKRDGTVDDMVLIPAGSFIMGCPENFDDCYDNELPRHKVELKQFEIMKFQVTTGQYAKCVKSGSCNNNHPTIQHFSPSGIDPSCNLFSDRSDDHPMNCVSWYGAQAYCEWTGMKLPTEAQWEYAARGNDDRIYPWGNELPTCKYAVMTEKERDWGCGRNETWSVGSKLAGASFFGLYDMSGNVWEWVEDDWTGNYENATGDGKARINKEERFFKVLRGGGYTYGANSMRATLSQKLTPQKNRATNGFRCVK